MIAYLTRAKDSNKEHGLPDACPWTSWYWQEGYPIVNDAIIVTEEEFATIMQTWGPEIQKAKEFVDTIPEPIEGEENLSVEELIKLRETKAEKNSTQE